MQQSTKINFESDTLKPGWVRVEISALTHEAVQAEINRLIEHVEGSGGWGTYKNPFRTFNGYRSVGEYFLPGLAAVSK